MFQVIYVSSARGALRTTELLDILGKSRSNNTSLGITGLLLHRDGNFMQMLEGERTAVEALFDKISKDPRHGGVITLFRGNVETREFPDWSMGFHDLMSREVRATPGFNEYLNTPLDVAHFPTGSRAAKLFAIFKW